jgi:hypothetical protein
VTFEIRTDRPQPFTGWQRGNLPGRTLTVTSRAGEPIALTPDRLPAIEMRVLRPDQTVALVGF